MFKGSDLSDGKIYLEEELQLLIEAEAKDAGLCVNSELVFYDDYEPRVPFSAANWRTYMPSAHFPDDSDFDAASMVFRALIPGNPGGVQVAASKSS